jgi:hypothetical protein
MSTFAEATSGDVGDGAGESAPEELEDAIDQLARFENRPGPPREFDESDDETVEPDANALVERLVDGSVEEIDGLIAELQMLRDHLNDEARRVRSELNVFARVGDSAMQTTAVLGKALGRWKGVTERDD